MINKRFLFCFFVISLSITFSAFTQSLSIDDALQSNMVLQQNKPMKVWGKANPGKRVSIAADWMSAAVDVIADRDGEYLGLIVVPAAKRGDFSKHTIQVSSGNEKKILENLLIGEVWLCSGQSNMQFSVKEMLGAEEVIGGARQPNIRLLNVGLNFSDTPISGLTGKWQACSPESVKDFSAVGYAFGKQLYDVLNIPVGIIFSGIGASGVQAYIPKEVLAADQLLNETYLKAYLESSRSKEKIDAGFSFEKVVRPYLLYNAMIHPLLNLSISGICWYQGESNHLERTAYVQATQSMIKAWRERFQQGELPFYYVQIAPFFHDKEDPALTEDAYFREAQERIATLNNTAMVSTMDVGQAKDLHPNNKKPVGLRLAAVALNRHYHLLSVPYLGPQYSHVDFKGKQAVVYFEPETLGGGLTTQDGTAPKFFSLAGADRKFYPATATIVNNSIVLSSRSVKKPVAVRYAFFNYPVTNLQNQEGFPVNPFRTDDWPETSK